MLLLLKKGLSKTIVQYQNNSHPQNTFFFVGERPFCFWDENINKKNLEFLEGLNTHFFSYIANSFKIIPGAEKEDDSQQSALLIRFMYSVALESFFALIACSVQAPYAIPVWINLYKGYELKNIIDGIQNEKPIFSLLNAKTLSWSSIIYYLLSNFILIDKSKESEIKIGFANLWSAFASEYLEEGFSDEFNGIKHGLRVHPGGCNIYFGIHKNPHEPVPLDKLQLVSKSDFGTDYFKSESIGNSKHHHRLKRYRRNWNPNIIARNLVLLEMSIMNIQSALKIINGIPADKVQLEWPGDFFNSNNMINHSSIVGFLSTSGPDVVIESKHINHFSKEYILSKLDQNRTK